MPRDAIGLAIPDLSNFARRLRRDLIAAGAPPGHLGLLNMLARAGGFGNFQHLRAGGRPAAPPMTFAPAPAPPPVPDRRRVEVALRLFGADGRMMRWPKKTSVQGLCLWALWARLPARRDMAEPEVNALIEAFHGFGDRALLRRSLIDHGLARRERDCSRYRRVERAPDPEARALIRVLADRR